MRKFLSLLLVVAVSLTATHQARAAFLTDFTGHVRFDTPNLTGWVSFAVYQNTGNWLNDLTSGGTPIANRHVAPQAVLYPDLADGTERYVYFYQIVRDTAGATGSAGAVRDLYVSFLPGAPYTAAGQFNELVFNEDVLGVPVAVESLPGANHALGTPSLPGTTTPVTGASLDATNPFADNAAALGGTGSGSSTLQTDPATGLASGHHVTNVQQNQHSTILYFTSQNVPGFLPGSLHNSGDSIIRNFPASTPEPASLLLMALGMAGVGYGVRRRGRKKAAEEPAGQSGTAA